MNRIQAQEWIDHFFSGKKPSLARIKRKIDNGELAGMQVGTTGIYVVYCDDHYNPINEHEKFDIEAVDNDLAKSILGKLVA